ncbi:hypothetical protein LMG28140_02386 [Paraburkholderia metrosideri]|jgi:IS5 family transposase|uniref:Transposase n=1 Tax=Paraburkholderia metrosideri TaxID=580937 RepID=A0ABM8NKT9_9BURK|nr:hypothetical protein LMG28140_02386 [Paraburkholderia metrosideri]
MGSAFGDAGYPRVDKRDEVKSHTVSWQIAAKRGKIKGMRKGLLTSLLVAREELRRSSSIRFIL